MPARFAPRAALSAGALYALIVFGIGFMFGTVRVLWIAPRLGATGAVLLEIPFMLGASWVVCRAVIRRRRLARVPALRVAMGASAFAWLIALELLLSAVAFGRGLGASLALYATAPGCLGLLGQIPFAFFPALQRG